MYHFSEGAIDDDSVSGATSMHVLNKAIEGAELSIVLITEPAERPADAIVAERLQHAEMSMLGFRNKLGKRAEIGGAEAISFGWEFLDDKNGYLAAHQIIAMHGGRMVSLSASFPVGLRDRGIAAMAQVASAIRWRAP
jgi:hypothetical protein